MVGIATMTIVVSIMIMKKPRTSAPRAAQERTGFPFVVTGVGWAAGGATGATGADSVMEKVCGTPVTSTCRLVS